MITRRYRVAGRVQGVFFRASTREEAARLELTGWVRNLPDGSVEVLACGAPEAQARLAAWLAHGPPLARVAQITTLEEATTTAFTGFEIR